MQSRKYVCISNATLYYIYNVLFFHNFKVSQVYNTN